MANGGTGDRRSSLPVDVSCHASHEAWVTTAILVCGRHGPVGND